MPTRTLAPHPSPAVPDALRALIALSHHRWSLPVLSYMQRKGGARLIELVRTLRIHRESLRSTLDALEAAGWIRPNTGYGHALRPELVFTRPGETIGPAVVDLMESITGFGREEPLLRKWALPITWLLNNDITRFSDLKSQLPGITPRALTAILKELIETELATRAVGSDYPPTVVYGLSRRGQQIGRRLGELVQAIEGA